MTIRLVGFHYHRHDLLEDPSSARIKPVVANVLQQADVDRGRLGVEEFVREDGSRGYGI